MFNVITEYFGTFKNALLAAGALFLGAYAAKQKFNAYQAESKLKTIETKIAKTNVIIAKKKAKADSVKIETDAEINTLKDLKTESKKVQKEMEHIEKTLAQSKKSKKVTIEV